MLFPTVQFAIFFPIVLALSWALMSRPRLWKPFITAVFSTTLGPYLLRKVDALMASWSRVS